MMDNHQKALVGYFAAKILAGRMSKAGFEVRSLSDFYEKAILDHVHGKSTLTPPSNYFVALCESAPVDGDDSVAIGAKEATYTSYARSSTASADWGVASGTTPTQTDNANPVAFPQSSGGSSVVTHFAVLDVVSGAGNMLWHGALTASRTISPGDTPEFAAGDLSSTLD